MKYFVRALVVYKSIYKYYTQYHSVIRTLINKNQRTNSYSYHCRMCTALTILNVMQYYENASAILDNQYICAKIHYYIRYIRLYYDTYFPLLFKYYTQ